MKGSDQITYNLVKVNRRTLEDARDKCRQQDPPVSLTWQIMKLLQEWTYR